LSHKQKLIIMETHNITFYGTPLEVTGTYYKGGWGSWEEMPTVSQFEIDKVEINGINVNELLEDRMLELEHEILAKLYD